MGTPMRYQPQGRVQIDRSNPLGAKVIECVPLNGQMSTAVSRGLVTLGSGGSKALGPRGYYLRGSGASGRASVPINLSKYSKVTVAFWLYWDAYANNDALAMEFGPLYGTNNGFLVDPNCSSPAAFMFGAGDGGNNNLMTFPRPSAGVWHRVLLTMDRSAAAGVAGTAYVDGVAQPISAFPGATPVTGNFGSDTLHLFSRNEASLFGTGSMEMLTFYAGVLSPAEAAQDYQNPYQIFSAGSNSSAYQAMIATATSTTGTSTTASLSWVEANDIPTVAATLTNRGSITWIESNDTYSMGTQLNDNVSISYTDATDACSVSLILTDRTSLAWSEDGDTYSIQATQGAPGGMAWTEANDSYAVTVTLIDRATPSWTEADDGVSVSTILRDFVSLVWTEADDSVLFLQGPSTGGNGKRRKGIHK